MNTYNGQDKIDSDRPSAMPAARSCRSQSVARVEHTDHDLERTCRILEIGSQHDDRAAIFAGSDSVLGVITAVRDAASPGIKELSVARPNRQPKVLISISMCQDGRAIGIATAVDRPRAKRQ